MSDAVVVKDLSVILGGKVKALNSVSLNLPAGQIIGFIGPSGAGKTTLIRTIVGRQKITSGQVTVLDQPAGSAKLRSQISYMTQERSVYPDLSVKENLSYFATMRGLSAKQKRQQIPELLQLLDLQGQTKQLYNQLSGGQKQRVSLAISLLGNPKLLLLDEPTVGLDPVLRQQLWTLFRQLRDQGASLIVSSHVMDEAEKCDQLILIRDGRVLAQDTPANLKKQQKADSVEQAFLSLVEVKA